MDNDLGLESIDPSNFIMESRRATMGAAVTSLDDDPQKVGRAYELARATGDKPALVYSDLDNYEAQHKAALTAQLLSSNSYLRDYIAADPMHAKLSNDDYPALDEMTQKLSAFRQSQSKEGILGLPTRAVGGMFGAAWEGFHEGIGKGRLGEWTQENERLRNDPFTAAVWATIGTPFELALRGLSGGIRAATEAAKSGAKEAYQTFTGDPEGAERFARDIAGMAEMQLTGTGVHGVHAEPPTGPKSPVTISPFTNPKVAEGIRRVYIDTKLWLDHGVEPPAGMNREVDKIKLDQNNADVDHLDDMLRTAQSSATRERDPETFARFVRMRDEGTIAIDGEAVRKLYGDKLPEAEDGVLGWEPSLATQLETAKVTGGDVEIPVADFLARVDPEVFKALKDDIRVRPGGVTKNEAKVVGEQREALQTLFSIDEQFTKIVDDAGKPLTVYHGTSHPNIKQFETGYNSFGNKEFKGNHRVISFSTDPEFASKYAGDKEGASVYPVQIDAKNPGDFRNPQHVEQLKQYYKDRLHKWMDETKSDPRYSDIWTTEKTKEYLKKEEEQIDTLVEHGAWQKWENPEAWKEFGWDAAWSREDPFHKDKDILNLAVADGKQVRPKFVNPLDREVLPSDLPQMRAHAGLEPLFSIGDRKLALEKQAREPKPYDDANFKPHDFKLLDEQGQAVGHLNLTEAAGGKDIHVDMISGVNGLGPRSFGPALMRDLLRQIKEEFPNAERLGGYRVSGAREKTGAFEDAWIKLDNPDLTKLRDLLDKRTYEPISNFLEAHYKPTELLTENEHDLAQAIGAEIDRLAPKQVDVSMPSAVRQTGTGLDVYGAHISYSDRNPFIIISLDGPHPIGTAQHEAIHHLRQQGFFTNGEWATLERAARDNGWVEKFRIEQKYSHLDTPAKLEEAIAEGFRDWKKGNEVPPAAVTIFERLKELFENIRKRVGEILGREVSWEELFQKVDSGEVGQREGNAPRQAGVYREALSAGEPELPGLTRMEDRPLFRTPATIGMTEKQTRLYERRLTEMNKADEAHSKSIAEKEQKKRLTAEWKIEQKNVRAEVEADMNQRPDVAADLFFARGELYGEKLGERYKIDFDDLTPEQRGGLPKDYVGKQGTGGVDLNDVASLVGYPTKEALIDHLVAYNQTKLAANMSAKAFRDRMVALETERQMANRYGNLDENILDAVKDQVTSETQLNLIAEEVLALGIRNGGEATINKAELKSWVQDKFAESPIAGTTSDKYLKAAGKGGQAAEIALLQGKFDEAYRAKQQQFMAMLLAKEARGLEKEQKQFAKTVQRLSKREVKGLDQDYQDHIQALLWQAGLSPRRSMIEIQRSQAISGKGSLETFVAEAVGDGWAPEVSPDIAAGRVTQLKDMTVEQFREFKDAIDTLNYIGRQVDKISREGRKEDFAEFRKEVLSNITSLDKRSRDSQEKGLAHLLFGADAELTRVEVMMKDLDLGQDMGPLVDMTIRPMADAKHKEYSLQEKLSKDIKAIETSKEWKKSLEAELPNDWFKDPSVDGGGLFKIRKMDLINIMLNWGNKSNKAKFTRGWGSPDPARSATKAEAAAFEAKMKDYIDTHATAEDWKFVQGVWNIYNGYRGDMETVWRNTSGTQPKLIEPLEVETPHGMMQGGYYPLIRDKYMSGSAKPEISDNSLFGADYPNYSTPQGHLKERTGATYYVDFRAPLERIPLRMQQVIHDIAFRDAVMAAKQVISDREIMKAITNHYGGEYAEQLRPWLERVARGATLDETALSFRDRVLRQTRMNLVNYALPLNYVVTYTPDVGAPTPRSMINYFGNRQANKTLANSLSKEIPHAIYNMDRDFREAMERAVGAGQLTQAKAAATRWGYGIVSYVSREFRTATFIDKFQDAKAEGRTDADAAAIADTYVRERHGSAALADLPAIMAGGEAGRLLTMFYGYWNTQYNWLRTAKGDLSRGEYMKALETTYGSIIIGAAFGALIANQAYKEDSYGRRMAKAIPMQLGGMIPYGIREMTMYVAEGAPPRTPLGSVVQGIGAASGDIYHWFKGDKVVDNGVKHAATAAGLLLGTPGALQIGRSGQGLWDVYKGRQHPKDIYEWVRLLHTGEAELKHRGQR